MRITILIAGLFFLVGYALSLNLFNSDASQPDRMSRLHSRLHGSSGSSSSVAQIRQNTFGASSPLSSHALGANSLIRESDGSLNPTTKTAAKAVACHTVGIGICAGVTAVKYAKKEANESSVAK